MPYKNLKVQKRYQHKWYLRKKAGLPTKINPRKLLTEEERKRKKQDSQRKYWIEVRKRRREVKYQYLGDCCFICKRKFKRLIAHRKDGKEHKNLLTSNIDFIEKELKSGMYVHLCYRCHKGVHFCMDVLNLNWKNIIQRIK